MIKYLKFPMYTVNINACKGFLNASLCLYVSSIVWLKDEINSIAGHCILTLAMCCKYVLLFQEMDNLLWMGIK